MLQCDGVSLSSCCSVTLPVSLPNEPQPILSAMLDFEYELLYTSEKYYNIHIKLLKKWQPFRSESGLRGEDVVQLQMAIYMQKKGNESAAVNIIIFYMEILHKLRL